MLERHKQCPNWSQSSLIRFTSSTHHTVCVIQTLGGPGRCSIVPHTFGGGGRKSSSESILDVAPLPVWDHLWVSNAGTHTQDEVAIRDSICYSELPKRRGWVPLRVSLIANWKGNSYSVQVPGTNREPSEFCFLAIYSPKHLES